MASFLAKMISKKVLGESMQNNYGKEDPYFETVPATRLDGTPSTKKTKKRRKALPPGISEHDGKVLTKVKRRAYRLDMSLFNCCGIRFGWSSVIAIIPVIGDAVDCFMAMMVLRTCQQVEGGLPKDVQAKMMFNIIVDFGIGLIPFLGDIADALFRANTKNAVVLEKFLREKGKKNIRQSGLRPPSTDPTDPDEFDRRVREESPPPHYVESAPGSSSSQPARPQENRKSGWFSFGSKQKQPDPEQGHHRSEMRRQQEPVPTPAGERSRRDRY
ncbi:PH domain-containing protein [Halenospora varia]|nr:PH domain-containing protein [Halenospora varia]